MSLQVKQPTDSVYFCEAAIATVVFVTKLTLMFLCHQITVALFRLRLMIVMIIFHRISRLQYTFPFQVLINCTHTQLQTHTLSLTTRIIFADK